MKKDYESARITLGTILDCGYAEVDMLLESNIDIYEIVKYLRDEELTITMESIYYNTFWNEIYEMQSLLKFNRDDFEICYNGICTSIYVKENKAAYYKQYAKDIIDNIEYIFGMEFQESVN